MTTITGTDSQTHGDSPRVKMTPEPEIKLIKPTNPLRVKKPQEEMIKLAAVPPIPITTIMAVPVPAPASSAPDA